MNDETIRLALDLASSSKDVQEVIDKLKGLRTTTMDVGQGYDVLERQVGEYDVLERQVIETTKQEITALQALGIELEKQAGLYSVVTAEMDRTGATMTRAKGTSGAGGSGILGASYAFQDFTSVLAGGQGFGRALGAVQNNIPMLVTALGAGAGLAGAVSIVTVGVGLLIDNWGNVQKLWKSGATEEETKRVKDLAKAVEEAAEAAEKLSKTLPQWQRAGATNVKRAVDAFGGEDVIKELIEGLKSTQGDFGPEANRGMAKTFMANLMQGDPKAVRMLDQMDLRGSVGRVLRGGRTPDEEQKVLDRGRDREVKEADEAFAEAKKKREEQEKQDAKDLEFRKKEAEKADRENLRKMEDREKALQKNQEDIDKGGEAVAKATHDEDARRIKDTDIGERAASRAGLLGAQGGAYDRFGRFRQMNAKQQEAYNQRLTARDISRRFPKMGGQDQWNHSTQIAKDAGKDVREEVRQKAVSAMEAGLNATQATQQAMMQTLQRLRQAEERANMLSKNAQAMTQRNQPAANQAW